MEKRPSKAIRIDCCANYNSITQIIDQRHLVIKYILYLYGSGLFDRFFLTTKHYNYPVSAGFRQLPKQRLLNAIYIAIQFSLFTNLNNN